MHHQNPFDRLLLAQAIVDDLEFLTADQSLNVYGARLIW